MRTNRNIPIAETRQTNRLVNDLNRSGATTIFETVRRPILLNSLDDPNGSASFFQVLFCGCGVKPDELYLDSSFIPNNYYNLYDSITFEEQAGGGPVTVTLPEAIYRIFDDPASNFQPALKALLDANSPNGQVYTVTYSEDTQKITVSSTGNFVFLNIDPRTNITYRSMGYNLTNLPVTQAFALSQTSTGSVNFLAGISNGIRVQIKELPFIGETSSFGKPYTFLIDDISVVGGFIQGKARTPYKCDGVNVFSKFTVELFDDMGRRLRIRDATTLSLSYTLRMP